MISPEFFFPLPPHPSLMWPQRPSPWQLQHLPNILQPQGLASSKSSQCTEWSSYNKTLLCLSGLDRSFWWKLFSLALAFYPEHSPVAPVPTFNELPASPCAIVSQPPTLGLPLRSGGYSCSEKVWLLPKPDGSSLPLMAEPWLSVWACLEPFSPGL